MSEIQELTIEVRGMTCNHCERSLTKALESVPGISQVHQVSYAEGLARITAGPGATAERIEAAVAKAGYRARVKNEPVAATPAIVSTGESA